MVTTANTVVAPSWVLRGLSPPLIDMVLITKIAIVFITNIAMVYIITSIAKVLNIDIKNMVATISINNIFMITLQESLGPSQF